MIRDALPRLVQGHHLDADDAEKLFDAVMTGDADPIQLGAMLALIQARGATTDELAAGARAMRKHLIPVTTPVGLRIVDTCGTGGTGSRFFNVSTSAAIVTAAAGRPKGIAVAKHGNRAVTSASGSSDVLQELGVNLPMPPTHLPKALDEAGICFCFAPAHHPGMKHAGPVRAALGIRTIFNLLGPLTNPAGAQHQLLGVGDAATQQLIAETLLKLDTQHAWVVTTELPDGTRLGELTPFAPVSVAIVRNNTITHDTIDPAALGLAADTTSAVTVENPQQSAALIQSVLAGDKGAPRNTVLLNAAAALVIAEAADTLDNAITLATQAIDSGAARHTLAKLAELSKPADG
ncbi:anthranilate phosphoribosyltransferase [Mucisphaera calidilacus]|uniref:Anthranilate phosphoribosyltransferase n=1 Tax=Mucisphaera calidilacus TaxID=2527982 RepID=A0A518C1C0_9BACT|nr:anthranilate phosphoribosyltransferase [Mucisphaera calidilacus]QDU73021.1 Anthranilate phosphoribosyltransferase [Mucisphaera calidilacus]